MLLSHSINIRLIYINKTHSYIRSPEVWIGLKWNRNLESFHWIDNAMIGANSPWDALEPDCMTGAEETHPNCPSTYNSDCVSMSGTSWRTSICDEEFQPLCLKGNCLLRAFPNLGDW